MRMSEKALRRALMLGAATGVLMAAGVQTAYAAEIFNKGGSKLEFTVEVGLGLFSVSEDYNTTGGLGADRNALDTVKWSEGYAIVGFKYEQVLDAHWTAYGAVTGVVNGDRGDGDPTGSELGDENGGQLQDAYGGLKWTSGKEGGPSAVLSGGRQKWVLGDGFLIAGDQPTGGRGFGEAYNEDGNYYMNARRVFSETAILSVETGTPLRFDAFYIGSEKNAKGKNKIAGINVDYVNEKYGTLGFTYIRGLEVENPDLIVAPFTPAEDGMNIYSVHGHTGFGVKDFDIAANYVREENSDFDFNEWAWYVMPSYTFSSATWSPSVYYRYASFSEAYDPLHYGATGWNTWFMGEIAANYSGPFSSNANVHSIGLKAAPDLDVGIGKWTGVGAYFNHYEIREPDVDFGDEIAVYAEFQLFENVYVAPLYSVLFPDQGYEDAYANDRNVHNFQLMAIMSY